MIPQLPSYTPTEYLPGSRGRYRQYPRSVRAQIPGTGYDVGRMRWAEQRLNLTGNQRQSYGNYANVPLRGLGDSGDGLGFEMTSSMIAAAMRHRPASGLIPLVVTLAPPEGDVESEIARAAADAEAETAAALREAAGLPPPGGEPPPTDVPLVEEEEGFFDKKVGPVPVWALGLGGVLVMGGGAWFMLRKKKPKKNRRRRRRR